jgi:hypothetical protein
LSTSELTRSGFKNWAIFSRKFTERKKGEKHILDRKNQARPKNHALKTSVFILLVLNVLLECARGRKVVGLLPLASDKP